jgi:type IV secretory pathway TraG/TraD family ATPase VirD4
MGQSGGQQTRTRSHNFSEAGRALLRPEEILQLDNNCLIVVQRGMSPILAQRVKWYQDPDFNPAVAKTRRQDWAWLWQPPPLKVQLIVAGVLCLIVLALLNRVNH